MPVENQDLSSKDLSPFVSAVASWRAYSHTLLPYVDSIKESSESALPSAPFLKPELLPRFLMNGLRWGAAMHGIVYTADALLEWQRGHKTPLQALTEGAANTLIGTAASTFGIGIGSLLITKAPLSPFFSLAISNSFLVGAIMLGFLPLFAHDPQLPLDRFSPILHLLEGAILASAVMYFSRQYTIVDIPRFALITGFSASVIIDKALHHGLDPFLS